MAYGVVNADKLSGSNGGSISPDSSVFRNRIINGAMVIDQRNAGASVSITTDAKNYVMDRFWAYDNTDGDFSLQQVSDAPAGFINSAKVTITTADASIGSGQYAGFSQLVEGLNSADLAWGTASASTVTLSFWVKSSLTGTFGGSLRNNAADRSYPFSYSISLANTWEQKSIIIVGDTTGTWLTTNGIGIRVNWSLADGSSRVGTAGSWVAASYGGATGQTQISSTLNATWQITGVQLEKGSTATSFDYRPYGTELALCQRYYRQVGVGIGAGAGSAQISFNVDHLSMRTTPSYTATANLQATDWYASNPSSSSKTIGISANDANFGNVYNSNFSGVTNGRIYGLQPSTSAIFASAEL